MQIRPLSYSEYYPHKLMLKSMPKVSDVNFTGGKQMLIAVKTEDFQTEAAKKLFKTIHSCFQRIGNNGNISDLKILSEELEFYNKRTARYKVEKFTTKVDTMLAIQKDPKKATLRLYRRYPNNKQHCVLEAQLDENGQMINGRYQFGHLRFERTNGNSNNLRRMFCDDHPMLPHGDNDREWGITAEILPVLHRYGDNSTRGMYEIFLELARLHTSLYK